MKVISLARKRRKARRTTRCVHREKFVSAQVLAFPLERLNQKGPRIRRDTAALFPLLDGISGPTDIGGHLRERLPVLKHIIDSAHTREYASDELSGQCPPMIPMTSLAVQPTIRPMGRASTPVRFRAEMAKRLSSARVVAGYATKKQAADRLGITLDRYEKWENGRTPVPAQYVAPVCELFHIDANYLFGIEVSAAVRKVG